MLIVDDEARFLTSLERALTRHSDVVSASSGEQAIELLGDGLQVDLVISDLVLPGKSGMDIQACIEERRPDLERRVLFLTGGVTTPQARRFVAENLDSVLMKPVDTARLDAIIHAVARGVPVQSAIEQTRPCAGG